MGARKQNAAFLKPATKLLFTLLLTVLLQSHTITKQQIISRAESFDTVPPAQLFDSINAFYTQLYIYDQEFSRELIGKLLSITKGKSPEAHFLCLSIKAEFHPERNIELIDSAYHYATKHNIAGATHEYYMRKSHFFRQNQQYDSSMVYLLRARDLAREDDFEGYVHILHLLGDIYYSVNLYDQAEKYYLLVDSLKGDPASWNYWRGTVIRNNLGLIALESKNYQLALAKFTESLSKIPDPPVTYSDSLSLAYDKRMIATIHYKTGRYAEAIESAKFPLHFSKTHNLDEHLFPLYLLYIRLYIATNQPGKLQKTWNEFKTVYGNKSLSLEEKIACTLAHAEVYSYLENFPEATRFYKSYKTLNDSLTAQVKSAAIMQLLTEKEYSRLEANYQQVKTSRLFLFALSGLLLLTLILLILRWRKTLKLNKLLSETVQTKNKLFSVISHDLKSPFNSLLGLSEVLTEKIKNGEYTQAEEFSRNIYQKSSELFALIENLLNWSASQRKTLKFNIEQVAIKPVIEQVIALYKVQSGHKHITLEYNEFKDIEVKADRTSLVTILSNLVSNAIKFTPENGTVRIKTSLTPHHFEIAVIDNGLGMTQEKAHHLFRLSHNESTPGTNNEKGTGLGLLVCKEFVEKNSGSIHVSSSPGKGTTFTVRLNREGRMTNDR